MNVCDRCLPKYVPATDNIIVEKEDVWINLCEKCKNEVLEFIHNPPEPPRKKLLGLGKRKESTQVEDRRQQ